jgi:hypothetical protein
MVAAIVDNNLTMKPTEATVCLARADRLGSAALGMLEADRKPR